METNKNPKYEIPEYDPYTGELNPYYRELTSKQTKMTKLEIKKCVLEILDTLYERNGFADWWDQLDDAVENKTTAELESIIERRLNKDE
jgi:hypothetical protein